MLWNTAISLLIFFAYVVGGITGVLLYPRPTGSFSRFLLWVVVGLLFALVALYNPCIRKGIFNTMLIACAHTIKRLTREMATRCAFPVVTPYQYQRRHQGSKDGETFYGIGINLAFNAVELKGEAIS